MLFRVKSRIEREKLAKRIDFIQNVKKEKKRSDFIKKPKKIKFPSLDLKYLQESDLRHSNPFKPFKDAKIINQNPSQGNISPEMNSKSPNPYKAKIIKNSVKKFPKLNNKRTFSSIISNISPRIKDKSETDASTYPSIPINGRNKNLVKKSVGK